MKALFLIILITILMVFSLSVGYATDYYLSNQTGNDNRTLLEAQNPATPWKSIDKVNTLFNYLKPGDAILLSRGETFYGTLHINASGSSTSPIKIGAYGVGPKPIITSFQPIQEWKSVGNGIFESLLPVNSKAVQVLLINGEIHEMGRYPNSGVENEGYMVINQRDDDAIYSKQLNSSPNWEGGEVVIRMNDWIINRYQIESQSGEQMQYNGAISTYNTKAGYGFFIQNHIGTLDSYGEWYFNPSTKKMYVYFGNVALSSRAVEVTTLDNLLTKDYRDENITIENIQFKGANGNAIELKGGNNIKISDSEIEFSGENGILALSVLDLIIERNSIRHSYNNGLYLRYGNDGAIIQDNEISNTALVAGRTRNDDAAGIGIFVRGESVLVQNNDVINSGYNGIQFNGNYAVLKNNYVDTFCLIKNDGGGIYTFGGQTYQSYRGRKIEGNIVTNGIGSMGGIPKREVVVRLKAEGIFIDDNSNNIDIIGNSIGNTTNSGLKMSNVSYINVTNNKFFNTPYAINLGNNIRGQDTRNVNITENQFYTKLFDEHSIIVKTYKNDIILMADFDNNYYFRPLGDEFSILYQYSHNGKTEQEIHDLTRWTEKYGKDQNSISNVLDIKTYTVEKQIGKSMFTNSSFDQNVAGLSCNDCEQIWDPNSKIDGGALRIYSPRYSSVKINIGEVKKDKTYLLKFKGYTNNKREGVLHFYLRYTGKPWQRLSTITSFKLTNEVNSFEVPILPYQDESEVSLMMTTTIPYFDYWVDDLEIAEVEATFIQPEDVVVFEYNPTKTSKTINLSGTYVNAKLEEFSGKVTIPSYGSLMLFRVSEESEPNENLEGLYYHLGNKSTVEFNDQNFDQLNSEFLLTSGSNLSINENNSNEELFQSAIFNDELSFKIPLKNGLYTVKTYHKEVYFGENGRPDNAGQRVFDISIEGEIVKKDLDLYLENNNKETILTFNNIDITDGFLNLYLNASKNNSLISGIAIIPVVPDNELGLVINLNTSYQETVSFEGTDFVPGSEFMTSADAKTYTNIAASNEKIFQSERFASLMDFQIPVENGTYTIKTYHNELYFGKGGPTAKAGNRVFDILLEGKVVKDDFDIFTQSNNESTTLTFQGIQITDGVLNLQLIASADNASISGISIIRERKDLDMNFNTSYQEPVLYQDKDFIPGSEFMTSADAKTYTNIAASNEKIFQSERFASILDFQIPVENGTYTIKTYHNELYFGKGGPTAKAGNRVFDILLEGKVVKDDFDIFTQSNNESTTLTFQGIQITDGVLNLQLIASADNASISGISIIQESQNIDPGSTYVFFLNTGGMTDVEFNGITFTAEENSESYYNQGSDRYKNDESDVEALFQTERNGKILNYTIPVPNGTYTIFTMHNEMWFGLAGDPAKAGQRVYDIALQGKTLKSNFDLFVENKNNPKLLIFENIVVTNGILSLEMNATSNNASISGIAIIGKDAKDVNLGANLRISQESDNSEDKEIEVFTETVVNEGIRIFPNPAKGGVTLEIIGEIGNGSVLIYNMNGQLISHFDLDWIKIAGNRFNIPLDNLSQGMYLIIVINEHTIIYKQRLIVNP